MFVSIDIVQSVYDSIRIGNMARILSIADEKIRIHLPESLGGTYYGKEGLIRIAASVIDKWQLFSRDPVELFESNNKIVVLGEFTGKSLVSEQTLKMDFIDLWKLNGEFISEAWFFYHDSAKIISYLSR